MSKDIKLPELGEQVESAVVLNVLVSQGDRIESDQPVLELETDKATTEVPSPFAGQVRKIHVGEGDEVAAGQTILTLEEAGEEEGATPGAPVEEEAAEREEADEEPTEREEADEEPAEEEPVEEAPPARSRSPRGNGPVKRRRSGEQREPPRAREPSDSGRARWLAPASPTVRRFARELGLDVHDVPGTGPGGRITVEDVKSHVKLLLESLETMRAPSGPSLPDFEMFGEIVRQPITGMRQAISEKVSVSWSRIPHVTQFDRADIGDVEKFRRRRGEAGDRVTLTAVLCKVVGEALRRFPAFNASLDPDRGDVIAKKYVHLAVAVDTDDGLMAPVIRDVDEKSLAEVGAELEQLAKRARARKISREELQGASFSLTNLGGLGTSYFTPIVTWPQVGVVGVGKAETTPVWNGETFEPRRILPLSISYDHRAVDGADAARFLRWIAACLEEPMRLLT